MEARIKSLQQTALVVCAVLDMPAVVVKPGTGQRSWYHFSPGKPGVITISLGHSMGPKASLAHELAHHLSITRNGPKVAAHGTAFVKALFEIIAVMYSEGQAPYPWHQEYPSLRVYGPKR